MFFRYQCANLSQVQDLVLALISVSRRREFFWITSRKPAKTSENAPPKNSKSKKPCPGADQSMKLSFGCDSFARAFLQTSTTIIKYVSHPGSCISWSGVVWNRFAFSKKAAWLEKPCPEANQPMELSFGLHFFTRVFLRLPTTIIKYDLHHAGNRRAVFRVFSTFLALFSLPGGLAGPQNSGRALSKTRKTALRLSARW